MKATLNPDTGIVTLTLTMDEWLMLPHYALQWEHLTEPEEEVLRALLKTAGNPEGYQGP